MSIGAYFHPTAKCGILIMCLSLFQRTPQTAHSLPLWPLSCCFNWKNGYQNFIKFWKLFYPLMH